MANSASMLLFLLQASFCRMKRNAKVLQATHPAIHNLSRLETVETQDLAQTGFQAGGGGYLLGPRPVWGANKAPYILWWTHI